MCVFEVEGILNYCTYYSAQHNCHLKQPGDISLGCRDISPKTCTNLSVVQLYYSYSSLLHEAWGNHHLLFITIFQRAAPPCPLLLPTASMNASTAGDSAASGCMVGGRRVNTGGSRGSGPTRARMPSWQRDPRLEWNHGSQAAMAATTAPPTLPPAAAAADAPPAMPG